MPEAGGAILLPLRGRLPMGPMDWPRPLSCGFASRIGWPPAIPIRAAAARL